MTPNATSTSNDRMIIKITPNDHNNLPGSWLTP
jgi:hypothetical protein